VRVTVWVMRSTGGLLCCGCVACGLGLGGVREAAGAVGPDAGRGATVTEATAAAPRATRWAPRRWAARLVRSAEARRAAAARARRLPGDDACGVEVAAAGAGALDIGGGDASATGAVARADAGPLEVPATFAWPGADGFFGAASRWTRAGADTRVASARGDECVPITGAVLSAAAFLTCPGGTPPGGPCAASGEQNTAGSAASAAIARIRQSRLQGGRPSITDLRVPFRFRKLRAHTSSPFKTARAPAGAFSRKVRVVPADGATSSGFAP
jgi:hypothetical protein